jgi:hypothetical protein
MEETKDSDSTFSFKVFHYIMKVFRNDGLEWTLKKRYSEIRDLRDKLAKHVEGVREFKYFT